MITKLTYTAAVDVNIYTSNPSQAAALVGNHENTEVGNFLRDYLDLDLKGVTDQLIKAVNSFHVLAEDGSQNVWTGAPFDEDKNLDLNHYEGDFKKRDLGCGCGAAH